MKLSLDDDEIREALAEALAQKVNYTIRSIDPEECWFEAKAGTINGEYIDDIYDVEFCYNTNT